jgi:hypothetical protein
MSSPTSKAALKVTAGSSWQWKIVDKPSQTQPRFPFSKGEVLQYVLSLICGLNNRD